MRPASRTIYEFVLLISLPLGTFDRKERTTYNFIRIDDRLQTVRDRDQSHVALELITKGRLNDGICLVIYKSPLNQKDNKTRVRDGNTNSRCC